MDKALKDFKTILDIKMGKIPPSFQALDDAFLPGFNVDKAFVGHLYMYCKNAKSPSEVIEKLKALNEASNGGLNAVGDRSSGPKKDKTTIAKELGAMTKDTGKQALDAFKKLLPK